jgi:hypothetical protein
MSRSGHATRGAELRLALPVRYARAAAPIGAEVGAASVELGVAEPLGGAWRRGARCAEPTLGLGAVAVVTEAAAAFLVGLADDRTGRRVDGLSARLRAGEDTCRGQDPHPPCFAGITQHQWQPLDSLPGPP